MLDCSRAHARTRWPRSSNPASMQRRSRPAPARLSDFSRGRRACCCRRHPCSTKARGRYGLPKTIKRDRAQAENHRRQAGRTAARLRGGGPSRPSRDPSRPPRRGGESSSLRGSSRSLQQPTHPRRNQKHRDIRNRLDDKVPGQFKPTRHEK